MDVLAERLSAARSVVIAAERDVATAEECLRDAVRRRDEMEAMFARAVRADEGGAQ